MYETVWDGDITNPKNRGLLCFQPKDIFPVRAAPRLPAQRDGAFKHVYRGKDLDRIMPVTGASRLIEQRLERGPATVDELQQAVGCHKNTIVKVLARLRRTGQLQSTCHQPATGRHARAQSHWIE